MLNSTEQQKQECVEIPAGYASTDDGRVLKIVRRMEAKGKLLKRYFTGKSCKNGHICERITANGSCVVCTNKRLRDEYYKNLEKHRDRCRRYYRTENGKKRSYESSRRWAKNNKEKSKEIQRKSVRKNRDYYTAVSKVYASRVRERIPLWQCKDEIKEYYIKSRELNLEVDHIVPINSKLVCGLHCVDNFQMLTRSENASKGNRYWPDMPE